MGRFPRALTVLRATLAIAFCLLMLLPAWGAGGAGATPQVQARSGATDVPQVGALQVVSFFFSPATVSSGTQTQGTIQLSGGVLPYRAWLNNSAPGCQPPSSPVVTSNATTVFNCQPNSPSTYNVHLDVLDSGSPAARVSATATLQVNSNGNGNSGGSGKSNGSGGLSLPSGLFGLLTIFAAVFLGTMVAIAAGVIAIAVSVSRRLRQINETLAAQMKPPADVRPPK
jgi:hypothetical protein